MPVGSIVPTFDESLFFDEIFCATGFSGSGAVVVVEVVPFEVVVFEVVPEPVVDVVDPEPVVVDPEPVVVVAVVVVGAFLGLPCVFVPVLDVVVVVGLP